jgi:hypothetical protein
VERSIAATTSIRPIGDDAEDEKEDEKKGG